MKTSNLTISLAISLFLTQAAATTEAATLVRADFDDSTLADGNPVYRIRSDANGAPCVSYDYTDESDPVCPSDSASFMLSKLDSFLRTISSHTTNPTRWLVLDFSEPLAGSVCPNLDVALANYPGRNPAAFSPVNPDSCTDTLEVRFFVYGAFKPGATDCTIRVIIDGPDLITPKRGAPYNQWNAKYELLFVNPVPIVSRSADGKTVQIDTGTVTIAELWTSGGSQQIGAFNMPFRLKLTKL